MDVNGAMFDTDEGVRFDASPEGMAGVKPIVEGGAITAANASRSTGAARTVGKGPQSAATRWKSP